MKHIMLLVAFITALFICNPAEAQEELAKPQPVLTVGVLEVVGIGKTPQHFGVYGTVLGGAIIPVDQTLTLVPLVGGEFCPETGSWGVIGFLIFDLFLTERQKFILTLEPFVSVVHDAVRNEETGGFDHAVYIGGGIGPTFIFPRFILSPNVGFYVDPKSGVATMTPTFLFSVPF